MPKFTSATVKAFQKRKIFYTQSLKYRRKQAEHYHIPLNLSDLLIASVLTKQRLRLGDVVIYDEVRPVKILAAVNYRYIVVQFLDRIDTPISRVDSRKLWSGIPYEPQYTQDEVQMQEIFGDFIQQAEPTNAFEDGWW